MLHLNQFECKTFNDFVFRRYRTKHYRSIDTSRISRKQKVHVAQRLVYKPALLCSPRECFYLPPAVPPCCAACRYVFLCSLSARPVVQLSSPLCCAAPRPALCSPLFSAALRHALLCSPPFSAALRVALCRAARPLVQPVGSLSCAGRPNLQLAGPSVLARPLVQPAENSCFSFGNTALQPARPAGPPFSVIRHQQGGQWCVASPFEISALPFLISRLAHRLLHSACI